MQNETQNQNIDSSQEVKVEEAPVQQTEMPQNQGVNTDPYRGPEAEESADIVDQKVTMSSEDLVGSDPKVTMNPEDLFGPETTEEPGNMIDIEDISVDPLGLDGDGLSDDISIDNWGPTDWDEIGSRTPEYVPELFEDEPAPTDQVEPPNSEAAAPLSPEAVSMPHDKIVDPAGQAEPTPGGYDGSGIAGGLDLDENGVFDQTENNPDNLMSNNGEEQVYTYDEDAYEDAEDALEDLQDALQDGDEEDLAEALEELQDYLGAFDKSDEEKQEQTDPQGDGSIPNDEQEPTSHEEYEGPADDQGENESPGNTSDEEGYSYDEDDYEDAEDALEDLQDALRDGDEEDRAEALEELQDYLGGFDKGGAEEDQSGEWITGINGDVWVDASGKAWDSPEQAKAAAQLPQDEEDDPHNHGDPEEVSNSVDKEPVDAPDTSEAAVSGAAVGAAGAAVGAGAVGEAGGLGETIDEALGVDGAGKVLGDLANGDLDGALDAATEQAGAAIDDALGIDGVGRDLDDHS